MNLCIVTTHLNRLIEPIQMSGHNTRFMEKEVNFQKILFMENFSLTGVAQGQKIASNCEWRAEGGYGKRWM